MTNEIRKSRVPHPVTGARGDNQNGAFILDGPAGRKLFVMISNGWGWDHVSASVVDVAEPPTWQEMCWIKDQFFEPEELVIQYHPPHSQYVNFSETLHLWRPQREEVPAPPIFSV